MAIDVKELLRDFARVERVQGQFVAVTADGSRSPITAFLQRIRETFDMDVVFVSQFVDGVRVIRHVADHPDDPYTVPEGASDTLEESYCHHVVEGRLPQCIPDTSQLPLALAIPGTHASRVGCHLAVPIVTEEGDVFGTVCCFSHHAMAQLGAREELEALKTVAALLADALH